VPPGVSGKVLGVRIFVRREKLGNRGAQAHDAIGEKLGRTSLRQHREDSLAGSRHAGAKRRTRKTPCDVLTSSWRRKLREDAARAKENIKEGDDWRHRQ